jgi:hypothetical protein
MTIATTELTITGHEAAQVERANASSATPIVFVHGLWLLPSSWDRWVMLFEQAGYVGLTPGWPDDPETVAEAREHPEVFAGKGIGEIADYEEAIIRRLDRKPVIIGVSRPLGNCGSSMSMQERQRLLIELCDILVKRRVRAPLEDEELRIADAALQSIPEARRRQPIVAPDCDLRRRGNSPEVCFDVVSENCIRLFDEVRH